MIYALLIFFNNDFMQLFEQKDLNFNLTLNINGTLDFITSELIIYL